MNLSCSPIAGVPKLVSVPITPHRKCRYSLYRRTGWVSTAFQTEQSGWADRWYPSGRVRRLAYVS